MIATKVVSCMALAATLATNVALAETTEYRATAPSQTLPTGRTTFCRTEGPTTTARGIISVHWFWSDGELDDSAGDWVDWRIVGVGAVWAFGTDRQQPALDGRL